MNILKHDERGQKDTSLNSGGYVSADSQRLQELIDCLVGLATIYYVEQFYYLTIEIPGFNKPLYERAIRGMRLSEINYPFEHCGFIMLVFGYE